MLVFHNFVGQSIYTPHRLVKKEQNWNMFHMFLKYPKPGIQASERLAEQNWKHRSVVSKCLRHRTSLSAQMLVHTEGRISHFQWLIAALPAQYIWGHNKKHRKNVKHPPSLPAEAKFSVLQWNYLVWKQEGCRLKWHHNILNFKVYLDWL